MNQFDLALFIPQLFVPPADPNYDPEFDLNGDTLLNVNQFDLDLLIDRLFKPVLPAPLVLSAPLVAEADGVDLLRVRVEASQPSFQAALPPATAPTLISQPFDPRLAEAEFPITPPDSSSRQTFEVSDGTFYAPLSLYDDVSTTGLELESNTDQIDLGNRTRRFLGNRAAAKPTSVDLSDSRVDVADFEEIDDVFHSVDWLDWLSDGSLNGLTDGCLWERALMENR